MNELRVCVVSGYKAASSGARYVAVDAYVYDWTGHHARFTETVYALPVKDTAERVAVVRERVTRKAQAWIEAHAA